MIPYSKNIITDDDRRAVLSVLDSGIVARGPVTRRLEEALCFVTGKKHAVAMANGTVALHAALDAADCPYVHSPTLTFSAIVNAALLTDKGRRLILYDSEWETMLAEFNPTVGATSLADVYVPMDYAGYPSPPMRAFQATVVRDASHSFGAEIDGVPAVARDDMSVFSFHPAKHVCAGEGGAVVTDNDEYAERLAMLRDNGRNQVTKKQEEIGLNYHMSEMHAALALSQLSRIGESISARREIAEKYRARWKEDARLILPADCPGHVYHLFVIRLSGESRVLSGQFVDELRGFDIIAQRHYYPLHRQPVLREYEDWPEFPNADRAWNTMVSIPMYFGLTGDEQNHVMDSIDSILDRYGH